MQTKSASTFQERPFVTANQETMKFGISVVEVHVYKVVCILPWALLASTMLTQCISFISKNPGCLQKSSEADRLLAI